MTTNATNAGIAIGTYTTACPRYATLEEWLRTNEWERVCADLGIDLDGDGGLRSFIPKAWRVIEPQTPFVPGWHIDAIAEHLEAVSRGDHPGDRHRRGGVMSAATYEAVIERDAGDGEHIHRWTIEGVYHPLVMSRSWYEPDEGDYTDIEACSLEVLDSDERVVSCRSVRYTDVPADVIERACEIIRGMDEVCP